MEHSQKPNRNDELVSLLKDIKNGKIPPHKKPLDLRGLSLVGLDLSGMDLSGVDLSGADLSGTNLSRTRLFKATLTGATLIKANLQSAELTGADMTGAVIEEANVSQAGLGMACLIGANLFQANMEGCSLSMANLENADLRSVILKNARMREVKLVGADLTSADLRGVDMSLSNVAKATFNNADMREARVRLLKGFTSAKWIGVDIRDIHFSGAYHLRRFIVDQNYIKEFRTRGRMATVLYYIWWITSDCGRSMFRWCIWIVVTALFYAWLYTLVGIDYGDHPTMISPLYYSVVTLTTLGYGDVTPVSVAGQILAMLEVTTGYMLLGGLLSIFSNILARRAD